MLLFVIDLPGTRSSEVTDAARGRWQELARVLVPSGAVGLDELLLIGRGGGRHSNICQVEGILRVAHSILLYCIEVVRILAMPLILGGCHVAIGSDGLVLHLAIAAALLEMRWR